MLCYVAVLSWFLVLFDILTVFVMHSVHVVIMPMSGYIFNFLKAITAHFRILMHFGDVILFTVLQIGR